MGLRVFSRRASGPATALLTLALLFSFRLSHAAEQPADPAIERGPLAADPTIERGQLFELAKKFVDTVGKSLETAEELLAEKIHPEDLRMQRAFDAIEDGEAMILQINLQSTRKNEYSRLNLEEPVTAIKQGRDVMISLLDFISASGFPIKVLPDQGTAKGWFVREDNTFDLNLGNVSLLVAGQPVAIEPGDVQFGEEDILVRGKALAKWFKFAIQVNPRGQKINVVTAQKWPIQEKLDRIKRFNSNKKRRKPEQPFEKSEYKSFTPPNLSVNLREVYSSPKDRPARQRTSYNVRGTGDLIGHQAIGTLSGTDDTPINTLYLAFNKSSEKNDLLGPLKARSYEFNDIRSVPVPFTGSAPVERGARVTNRDPFSTLNTTTTIEGYAPFGWDVELYLGSKYVNGVTVVEDGRYLFENVTLFAGDNKFRVVQYGPQGEYREEERIVTVTPGAVNGAAGLYNVSVSQQFRNTYRANPSTQEDAGTPHLAGTYERQLTKNLILRSGLNARQQNGEQIAYFQSGLVSILNGAIYNADLITTTDSTYLLALAARRNYGRHNFFGSVRYESPRFVVDLGSAASDSANIRAAAEAHGPIKVVGLDPKTTSYDADISFQNRGDAGTLYGAGFTLSTRISDVNVSNALNYQAASGQTAFAGADTENLEGFLTVQGRAFQALWRTRAGYDVLPRAELTKLNFNVSRKITKTIQGEVTLDHNVESEFTTAETSLSWQQGLATISPSVSYDSDETLEARVNVTFGLAYDPYNKDIIMKGANLSALGGVSAFVFLDKEGDGLFTQGDEPLQDVSIEALQVNKNALTDDKGQAFLFNLSPNKITDIVVQENSTFDPNWLPGYKGFSLRPRAGHTVRAEFPILRGAEMDGTAYLQDRSGNRNEARDIALILSAPDGTVEKTARAPSDGFFLFTAIRPGVYYMTADASLAPFTGFLVPKKIVITPEGGVFYGQNVTLFKDYDIPFVFRSLNQAPTGKKGARVVKPTDIDGQDVLLRLGDFNSRVSMTLSWYKFRLGMSPWNGFFKLEKPMSEVEPDRESAKMWLTLRPEKPLTIEQAASVCQDLIDNDYACGVEIVTTYRDYTKLMEEENVKEIDPASYKKPETAASEKAPEITPTATPEEPLPVLPEPDDPV